MVQQVKSLPETPTFLIRVLLGVLVTPVLIQLPANASLEATEDASRIRVATTAVGGLTEGLLL